MPRVKCRPPSKGITNFLVQDQDDKYIDSSISFEEALRFARNETEKQKKQHPGKDIQVDVYQRRRICF